MSLKSDEQGLILHRPRAVTQYINWINHIFEHPPPRPKVVAPTTRRTPDGRIVKINPYAHVELD